MVLRESDDGRERRITESQARARAEETRRAILDLLRDGPMSSMDLRAKLPTDASISLVNYHLTVLVNAREVVSKDGLYRLA